MFVDIHVHARLFPGPLREGKPYYAAPEQVLRVYDRLGIERGVLMVGVSPECAYQAQSNEEALRIAAGSGGRLIPFCNIDPRAITNSPDAPLGDLVRHYRDQGCKGLGECTANLPFSDLRVQNLFHHLKEAGMPITFHVAPQIGGCYGLYDDPGLPQLERSLADFPSLKFFGHSQPFWAEMAPLEKTEGRAG